MSQSVKLDTEDVREAQAWAQEPATAQCEAERRIKMALYVMENDWGAGTFDYAKIRGILTGRDTEECTEHMGIHGKLIP